MWGGACVQKDVLFTGFLTNHSTKKWVSCYMVSLAEMCLCGKFPNECVHASISVRAHSVSRYALLSMKQRPLAPHTHTHTHIDTHRHTRTHWPDVTVCFLSSFRYVVWYLKYLVLEPLSSRPLRSPWPAFSYGTRASEVNHYPKLVGCRSACVHACACVVCVCVCACVRYLRLPAPYG